ncbi:MAG: UDP-2,3-diacylglucosamine diphosphatase [Saprospiraceae bacterium]|nr:MAG: UDP-2,3-diacylglucosamine diphosphatase [Saprospiraceae bacterium]
MGKIVFASDFHLGQKGTTSSEEREKALVCWIDEVAMQAEEVFFLGDTFDFWYEYKSVIPKGFTRFLGAMARLADAGIPIHLFTGNHDMWIFDYFTKELGIPLYRQPTEFVRQGRRMLIGHGDGLGPGDRRYKFLKKIFNNRACIWLFHWLHPSIGMWIANKWSSSSRESNNDYVFTGPEKEYLLRYCEGELKSGANFDYMIFGHRHLPIDYLLSNEKTRYINTGDWLRFKSYGVMENGKIELKFYNEPGQSVISNDPESWKSFS